jgi:hypothetical protein
LIWERPSRRQATFGPAQEVLERALTGSGPSADGDRGSTEAIAASGEGTAARARVLEINGRTMNDPTVPLRTLLEGAEQAVAVFERLGDVWGQTWAGNFLGRALFFLGRSRESAEAYERARRHADAAGDRRLAIEVRLTVVKGCPGTCQPVRASGCATSCWPGSRANPRWRPTLFAGVPPTKPPVIRGRGVSLNPAPAGADF